MDSIEMHWSFSMITLVIKKRLQKMKGGSSFSAYLDIIYGVSQGSILGLLLFNIDLCDLFFEDYSSDFENFADDITPYSINLITTKLISLHLMVSIEATQFT